MTCISMGRTDHVIVLSSGANVVPGYLEDIVNADPLVAGCCIFGRGEHQIGLLVQPKDAVDVLNPKAVADFIRKLQ